MARCVKSIKHEILFIATVLCRALKKFVNLLARYNASCGIHTATDVRQIKGNLSFCECFWRMSMSRRTKTSPHELFRRQTFCFSVQMKEKELKVKGGQVSVTEDNKTEYVDLMVQWRLGRGIHEQTKSFRKVFTQLEIFCVLLCINCSECMWLRYSLLVCNCKEKKTALVEDSLKI